MSNWIGTYILNGHTAVPADTMTWARWFEGANRHVAVQMIGDVRISTVFLGIDHNHGIDSDVPILFETMIFGGSLDQEQERCSTWEQAEQMHAAMVKRVKESMQ
jgi:hypothetical protein